MEIQYKRTYAPARGKRYTAGEIPAMLGYAMEIADPRAVLERGKLEPGEICMLLFALTPQEYAWRERDAKALDALAERLRRDVPADRLIAWRVCDLKGAPVARELRPRTGESIDGGALAAAVREKTGAGETGPLDAALLNLRRLQRLCAEKDAPEAVRAEWSAARRELGSALLRLERVYIADEALLNGRWPSVGYDGRLELFTLESRARRAQAQIAQANGGVGIWQMRAATGAELEDWLRRCAGDGLTALRIDNGFAAAELQSGDALAAAQTQNAALRSMLIREIECAMRCKHMKEANAPEGVLRGALEAMLSLRNFAWRELGRSKAYVLCAGADGMNCVCLNARDGGERMLAVFTEKLRAAAFAERAPGNPRALEVDFDGVVQRAQATGGLIIDAGEIGYRLPKPEFDRVRELRDKPPQAVRIQPPQPAEQGAAAPAAERGSLPDPDRYAPAPGGNSSDAARASEAPHGDASAASEADSRGPSEKGRGFFRRLFGK